jgi:hypothetical protein
MRQIRCVPGLVGIALGLLVACGGQGDGGDVVVEPGASIPADAVVEALVAGDDDGWVMTSSAESAARQLWRLQTGGDAEREADVPELASPDMSRLGGGVAVAGVECRGGGIADCSGVVANVYVVDGDGEVGDPVQVWERDGPLEDGDGLAIVGSTDDSVLVEHDGGLSNVTRDGQVSGEFPRPEGSVCVLDGRPYALLVSAPPGPTAPTEGPPTAQVSPQRDVSVTYTILALDGQEWELVTNGAQSFLGTGPVARCTPDGFSVQAADGGHFFGMWRPRTGWESATDRGVPVELPSGAHRAFDLYESSIFALDVEGTVLRRTGRRYEPTALRLAGAATTDSSQVVSTVVDEANGVVVGCVTSSPANGLNQSGGASSGALSTSCDVAL